MPLPKPSLLDLYMDVSKNRGTPKWMVYKGSNPIKMDDLGGFYHPYFWFNTHFTTKPTKFHTSHQPLPSTHSTEPKDIGGKKSTLSVIKVQLWSLAATEVFFGEKSHPFRRFPFFLPQNIKRTSSSWWLFRTTTHLKNIYCIRPIGS